MISAFLLGLAGSWHCAAMCGGLAWGKRPLPYLLGRWLGYACVGAVLGHLGLWVMQFMGSRLVLGISGSLLLAMGCLPKAPLQARNGFSLMAFLWTELGPWLRSPGPRARFLLGLATALFPCGLLSAAWLQAANAGSAPWGALTMAAFAGGSLPGLLAPRWLAGRFRVGPHWEKLALMLCGSFMLAAALLPSGCQHCH